MHKVSQNFKQYLFSMENDLAFIQDKTCSPHYIRGVCYTTIINLILKGNWHEFIFIQLYLYIC